MTKILWDQVGSRSYETGLSLGVLYLSDGTAVPWNGLKSVDEVLSDDTSSSIFIDGLKVNEAQSYGDFAATLTAFTFPDEFLEYDGVSAVSGGIFVDAQAPKPFGLSYRTEITDDLGTSGYRIHILYNVIATTSSRNYSTTTESIDPMDFSWDLSSTPNTVTGFRPTAHIIVDSRYTKSYILSLIENTLYGTATTAPSQPALQTLIDLITGYSVISIVDNNDGTVTITGDSSMVFATSDSRVWEIDNATVISSDSTSYTITDTKDM